MVRGPFAVVVVALTLSSLSRAADPPAQLTELSLPTSVQVKHPQRIIAAPLAEISADPLPDFLRGATVLTRPIGNYGAENEAAGLLHFTAAADGPLFLAMRYAPPGGQEKGRAEAWSEKQLLEAGWLLVAQLHLFDSATPTAESNFLWVRQCTAGESFDIRCRRDHPPIVIVADPQRVAHAVDVEPHESLAESRQAEMITNRMNSLLGARRFDELERWITRYVDEDPQFASGRYKIKATNRFFPTRTNAPEVQAAARKYIAAAEAWLAAKPKSLAAKLVLGRLLTEYARMVQPFGGDGTKRIDELEARSVELITQVGQARPKLTDVYRTYVMQMFFDDWKADISKKMVLRAVDSGSWCPQVIGEGLLYLHKSLPEGPQRVRQLRELFDECVARSPEKYRAALPAACFKDLPASFAKVMPDYGVTWPEMRAGFDALESLFPDSAINAELAAKFGTVAGDREFTGRMFAKLGTQPMIPESIWEIGELSTARAWSAPDYADGDQKQLFEYTREVIEQAQWLPDGRIFLCDDWMRLATIDPATALTTTVGRWDRWRAQQVHLARDAETLTYCTWGGHVCLREYPSGKTLNYASLPDDNDVSCVSLSPDGKQIAAADKDTGDLVVYQKWERGLSTEREPELRTPAFAKPAVFVAYRDEGREIVTFDSDGMAEVWRSRDLTEIKRWKAHTKWGDCCATLSLDGNRLATYGGDKTVRIWTLPGGDKVAEFSVKQGFLNDLAFSPDGRLLAGGNAFNLVKPTTIQLWNIAERRLIRELRGHKSGIIAVDFSHDGKQLLSGSLDKYIRVWDVPTE